MKTEKVVVILVLALGSMVWPAGPAGAAPMGTAFTYQGRLIYANNPADGLYDFQFKLFDDPNAGSQKGGNINMVDLDVIDGYFTVQLDFGDVFYGDAHWLEIGIRPSELNDPNVYTILSPRQEISPTPYALYTKRSRTAYDLVLPYADDVSTDANAFWIANSGKGRAIYGKHESSGNYGILGDANWGVYGRTLNDFSAGVAGESFCAQGAGVYGKASGTGDSGIRGESMKGNGVEGRAYGDGEGVRGESYGNGHAIKGRAYGDGIGVYGENANGNWGALGCGLSAVVGKHSSGSFGSLGSEGIGVYAEGSVLAGHFVGNVAIQGSISKSSGSFKIDHPLDPANKFLQHSFVESPDMMNIYNGNITLDEKGEAFIELPKYFEALNSDFRYQLTAIGAPAPNLHIAEKISNNRFKIAGGKAGMEVSWQVTGIRQDPYAVANRIVVEEDKPEYAKGYYLHPAAYGLPKDRSIENAPKPKLSEEQKAVAKDVQQELSIDD
jgi:hypothetical protein